MTFADKLQRLRKAKGLSQENIAEKCDVTRQSVSKWETGLGYPETEKLMVLCELLGVSLDYLLRDENDAVGRKGEEQVSPYAGYIGKWVQVFLKDKEFHGFYCVGLVTIQGTQLLFVDDKCKAIWVEASSVSTISNFTKVKHTRKLPPIPDGGTVTDVGSYFINKKCNIKLKQQNPLLGFNKPGGFYSVTVEYVSADAITAHDPGNGSHTVQMNYVLFIQEK